VILSSPPRNLYILKVKCYMLRALNVCIFYVSDVSPTNCPEEEALPVQDLRVPQFQVGLSDVLFKDVMSVTLVV
jgi:hypothetical protein